MGMTRRIFARLLGTTATVGGVSSAAVQHKAEPEPSAEVKWTGWPRGQETVKNILDANKTPGGDILIHMDFYEGKTQWEPEIAVRRINEGRPCLTVNQLPSLAAHFLANSEKSHETVTAAERFGMCAIIARENADAQRAYNYMVSQACERSRAIKA